jgi:hypothetical protein
MLPVEKRTEPVFFHHDRYIGRGAWVGGDSVEYFKSDDNARRIKGSKCNFRRRRFMSFVTAQPEALAAAASSLAGIGSAMNSANAAAAAPTTGVVPAAADEVSALTAAQFAAHAQMYQAVAAQAAAIHEQFVAALGASSGSYAATEAANAAAAT